MQTRRNDPGLGVANRQTWTVHHVTEDGAVYVSEAGTTRRRQALVRLPAEYVVEDVDLAHATTAYGVQGSTVDVAHTVLSDALDAAGVYVAMTRGREINQLHIVAADLGEAREQFTAALTRDRADRGLAAAATAAREATIGLLPHGLVAVVNTERARLHDLIARIEQEAARATETIGILAEHTEQYESQREQHHQIVAAAHTHVTVLRHEVTNPLIAQATIDATALLTTRERMWGAHQTRTGRLRKRSAERAAREATTAHREIERAVLGRWGDVPQTRSGLPAWAEATAARVAEQDRRLIEATRHSEHARRYLTRIESLPSSEAARLVRKHLSERAAAEKARAEAEARAMRRPSSPPTPVRRGPGHDRHREM